MEHDCWCKDEALPKIDSLWIDITNPNQPLYRVIVIHKHGYMCAVINTPTGGFDGQKHIRFGYNNTIDMNHLNSFYNTHIPFIIDEV